MAEGDVMPNTEKRLPAPAASDSHQPRRGRGRRPPPALVALALALALAATVTLPRTASAYSKFEHEQLTFYAFEIARQMVCQGGNRPPTCDGFDETHGVPPTELGVVTRAVDYFTNPGRLAPGLDACRDPKAQRKACEGLDDPESCKKHGGCRDKVVKTCKTATDEECLSFALRHTREKVVQRRNNRFYRALAVHRNDEHFRDGAQKTYNTMHQRAIKFAGEGRHELALVAESIAIHFLQDGFAPGHLAAPRDQYGDSHAGALHDRANREGLDVWVAQDICDAAVDLRKPLQALLDAEGGDKMRLAFEQVTQKRSDMDGKYESSQWTSEPEPTLEAKQTRKAEQTRKAKQIPEAKRIPLETIRKDLSDFDVDFCQAEIGSDDDDNDYGKRSLRYSAFGDKRLLAGKARATRKTECEAKYQSHHRASLLTLAVMSITDVLRDDPERPLPLQLCFHPPKRDRGAGRKNASAHLRFQAPALAVGRRDLDYPWPVGLSCWQGRSKELIFGYSTDPSGLSAARQDPSCEETPLERQESTRKRYDLRVGAHQINSIQAAVSYWGAERRRFELGHDVVATEKYFEFDPSGVLQAVGRGKFVATAGYVVHYEAVPELEVLGAGLLLTSGTQFKDFDIYGAVEPGIGHYRHPAGETTRFRWSVRAGLGLSIVAIEGIVERGFELTPSGGLEKEWRPSVNLRFRVAPSWLALPFQKLKGKGKQPAVR